MPTWKDIKGYEGIYQVSDTGEVKSLDRMTIYRMYGKESPTFITGKPLCKRRDKYGYNKVVLCKDGRAKAFMVHRLVAEAFIDNVDNLATVNHKDMNKRNNNVKNLEWADNIYQCNHKTNNHKRMYKGELLTISEIWRKYCKINIKRTTLLARLRHGWNIDEALTLEVKQYANS
jgi:hypothetical protein